MKARISFICLSLTLSACSAPAPSKNHANEAGTQAIIRIEADPDSLNPAITTTALSNYILVGGRGSMISEWLLRADPRTGEPAEPGLATGYPDVSADHRVYTFTLRDGVKWHDGRPFSAEDVLFTVKAAMVPAVDAAAFRAVFSSLVSAEIVGRNQIRFRMKEPYWLDAASLGTSITPIPKHVYDPSGVLDGYTFAQIIDPKAAGDPALKAFGEGFNKNPANRAPIGTGPYKLHRWQSGQEIVLQRNDDYWGQKPHLEKLVFKVIPDATTALTVLKSGEIDFMPRLSPVQAKDQTDGPAFQERFTKANYQIPQLTYIGWNETRPFFADKRVRQALTMLVNRPQVIETVRRGMGMVATSPFVPGSPDFNDSIQPLPYDPKRAAQLLDEAGWVDHNQNGIRDKNGVEFKFEILASSTNAIAEPLVGILRDELGKVGISVTSRRLDGAVFQRTVHEHKADAAIQNLIIPLLFDPYQLFHSNAAREHGLNFYNFRNPEADAVMEQARVEFDVEKRKRLYWRFQEIFHDEQPYTLLFYPQDTAAYHVRFQNVHFMRQRPGYDLTQWRVGGELAGKHD